MQGPATYRITVRGTFSPDRHAAPGGVSITRKRNDGGEVHFMPVGYLPDQAALDSTLNTLYALHLPIGCADYLETG